MKKTLVLGLLAVAGASFGQVSWLNDATGVLQLTESIVDNGNGTWTYNYTMSNMAEQSPIWWVVVYFNGGPGTGETPFGDGSHVGWDRVTGPAPGTDIDGPAGEAYYLYSWSASDAWPDSTPNGIHLGETVGGMSVTLGVYDPSAKNYVADKEGDWGGSNLGYNGNGDQIFTYGGTTVVPEPATLTAVGLGVAALLRKRRK